MTLISHPVARWTPTTFIATVVGARPMTPARSSTRRTAHASSATHLEAAQILQNDGENLNVFLEPNFGTPLQIYIEKDVEGKELLRQLIHVIWFLFAKSVHPILTLMLQKHGGVVSSVYSRVAYILGTGSSSLPIDTFINLFQWIRIRFLAKICSNNTTARKVKSYWMPIGSMSASKRIRC